MEGRKEKRKEGGSGSTDRMNKLPSLKEWIVPDAAVVSAFLPRPNLSDVLFPRSQGGAVRLKVSMMMYDLPGVGRVCGYLPPFNTFLRNADPPGCCLS